MNNEENEDTLSMADELINVMKQALSVNKLNSWTEDAIDFWKRRLEQENEIYRLNNGHDPDLSQC